MERWLPVKDYQGLYEVSNLGRVRSVGRHVRVARLGYGKGRRLVGKMIAIQTHPQGYKILRLCKCGIPRSKQVHRLVLEAFRPTDTHLHCNHKNGIKSDNRLDNLEWLTQAENNAHAARTGLMNTRPGTMASTRMRQRAVDCFRGDVKIATFLSLRIAGDYMNTCKHSISGALRGVNKTAGGYIWEYSTQGVIC